MNLIQKVTDLINYMSSSYIFIIVEITSNSIGSSRIKIEDILVSE